MYPSSHNTPSAARRFASPVAAQTPASRKRKADHVVDEPAYPTFARHGPLAPISSNRVSKRARRTRQPRKLNLDRILEPLDADSLRAIIQGICVARPDVHEQLLRQSPRPSADDAMKLLTKYENAFRAAFPIGGNQSSDYSFNRVQSDLLAMLEALKDFTPSFLPPTEPEMTISLGFLDAVTDIVHRIPQWDSVDNNRHKEDAYDELADGWAAVIREAAKRGGGFQFINLGWDSRLARHNQLAGGKLEPAIQEMKTALAWADSGAANSSDAAGLCGSKSVWSADPDPAASLRQQLLDGTYGRGTAVQVGPW